MMEKVTAVKYDVVIVGAGMIQLPISTMQRTIDKRLTYETGWYGLVAARNYLRLRPQTNLLIIDSSKTVGGVWSKERLYPNLIAQVPPGFFNYTDTPMRPQSGAPRDSLIAGDTIHDYLQKYAEHHNLMHRIRFVSLVTRAERCSIGWRLHCETTGEAIILETAKLIVATGITSIPRMPEFRARDISIPIIHSKDLGPSLGSLKAPETRAVVVVGAAKSAYDTVYLLLSLGKRVIWIIRPGGTGPHTLLPLKVFGYWSSFGVASTRFMSYVSPSILNVGGGPLETFFQRTALGRWCIGKFWDTLNYLSDRHAGYSKGDHVSMLKPDIKEKRHVFPLINENYAST